jgi:hypothetical protein
MPFGSAGGRPHFEWQSPYFAEPPTASGHRHVLHQRDLLKTTQPIEDLATERKSLIAIRQTKTE